MQETKLIVVDDVACGSLWGLSSVGYSYRPSIGGSGGILSLWDTDEVEVWFSSSFDNVLIIKRRFLKNNIEFDIANVYAF